MHDMALPTSHLIGAHKHAKALSSLKPIKIVCTPYYGVIKQITGQAKLHRLILTVAREWRVVHISKQSDMAWQSSCRATFLMVGSHQRLFHSREASGQNNLIFTFWS